MTQRKKEKKIFVLDTSVILFDHASIRSFEEHDVAIPITVLEELDQFKKGKDTKNYEAREFIRFLDQLSGEYLLQNWIPLNGSGKGRFRVLMYTQNSLDAEKIFGERKADHRILNSALRLAEEEKGKKVILVSKDVNLRLKAKALNLHAEDYMHGKIEDLDRLDVGSHKVEGLSRELIDSMYADKSLAWQDVATEKPAANQYFILRNGKSSVLAWYNAQSDRLELVQKSTCYGINPRNAEQTFALHAVMNPNIRLVSLMGVAGTGKTLLALAGALEVRRDYRQIYLARPIVPLSNKDIGYLPGEIKDKIGPYMEPLWDNLKFIQHQFGENTKEFTRITEMLEKEKLIITPLAYIRGRSLSNIIFIVDEAQNLTPHEIKTIITRAGENTKLIFTGDIRQIDTPYLDSESNGLSHVIARIKNHPLYAHVTLEKGERSELANLANELL